MWSYLSPLVLALAILYASPPSHLVFDFLGGRLTIILAQIGVLSILRYIYILYNHTIRPIIRFISAPPREIYSKGKWVVMSNIVGNPTGEAFARHVVEEGCNVMLLGAKSKEMDGLVSVLDKSGYIDGHRTKIETISWNADGNEDDDAFWIKLGTMLGDTVTDDGLGLVLHCCSNSSSTRRRRLDGAPSSSDTYMDTEGYSRRLVSTALPHMSFRNQGAIICISSEGCGASDYPDRNDLLDCAPACAAYTRELVQSLHSKYLPLGIDCLSVVEYPRVQDRPPKGTFERLVLKYLGPPSADTVVEASLKALGSQPLLTPTECLLAQACRYSVELEEKVN